MSDYLKLVPNEEKKSKPTFTYNEETAKNSPPESIYLGEINVKDICPDLYPADTESSETKERCERALEKFWGGEDWYCTVAKVITVGYNRSSVFLILEDTKDVEFPGFTTEKSWEEILEEVRKEFSWIDSPESGLRMNMTVIDCPEDEISRMKIEIKGVYPFYFPFLKYRTTSTDFLTHAINVKFQQHLYSLQETLRTRKRTREEEESLGKLISKIKKAFDPSEKDKEIRLKLHLVSNEEKGEIK